MQNCLTCKTCKTVLITFTFSNLFFFFLFIALSIEAYFLFLSRKPQFFDNHKILETGALGPGLLTDTVIWSGMGVSLG